MDDVTDPPSRIPAAPTGSGMVFLGFPGGTAGVCAAPQLYFDRSIPPVCLVSVFPPEACLSSEVSVQNNLWMTSKSVGLIQRPGSLDLLVLVPPRSAHYVLIPYWQVSVYLNLTHYTRFELKLCSCWAEKTKVPKMTVYQPWRRRRWSWPQVC